MLYSHDISNIVSSRDFNIPDTPPSSDSDDDQYNYNIHILSIMGQYFKLENYIRHNLKIILNEKIMKKEYKRWINLLIKLIKKNTIINIACEINIDNIECELLHMLEELKILAINQNTIISKIFIRFFKKYKRGSMLKLNCLYETTNKNNKKIINQNIFSQLFEKNKSQFLFKYKDIFYYIQQFLTLKETLKLRLLSKQYTIYASIPHKIGELNLERFGHTKPITFFDELIEIIEKEWGKHNILSHCCDYEDFLKLKTNINYNTLFISYPKENKNSQWANVKQLIFKGSYNHNFNIIVTQNQFIQVIDSTNANFILINNEKCTKYTGCFISLNPFFFFLDITL